MRNCLAKFICKYPKPNSPAAFSLVEMLMALLVASLLLAALAPVMTKKLSDFAVDVDNISTPGLQVWNQPGEYTFTVPAKVDKLEIQAAAGGGGGGGTSVKKVGPVRVSSQNFIVPKGVNKVTFTLIGAGGAGGAANGAAASDTCTSLVLPAFADSGKDMCVSNVIPHGWNYLQVVKPNETATILPACWVPDSADETSVTAVGGCDMVSKPVASSYFTGGGCRKPMCNYEGTLMWCNNGVGMRLLTKTEMERIVEASTPENNFKWLFGEGLDLAVHRYGGNNVFPDSVSTRGNQAPGICKSTTGSYTCNPYVSYIEDGTFALTSHHRYGAYSMFKDTSYSSVIGVGAAQFRCVREMNNWNSFAGGGGASGARLLRTIDVKPGDTLAFAIAQKAQGGTVGANPANYSGNASCVSHTDSSTGIVKKYCAAGGRGGNPATTAANGAATAVSYKAGCYVEETGKAAKNITDGCTLVVNEDNGTGAGSVSVSEGGTGAGGTMGGTLDTNDGAGYSAADTQYGYGGGGGACKRGVRTASACSAGGSGGPGYGEISYNMLSPGGGGGAGGAVGFGSASGVSVNETITLNVKPYAIVYITVGAGGSGASGGSVALKGGDTRILIQNDVNSVVFEGGYGGNSGSFGGSGLDTVQTPGTGGLGGKYPNYKSPYSALLEPDNDTKGSPGGLSTSGNDGGQGGKTRLGAQGSCGGMQMSDGVCENALTDGLSAVIHNIISNKYGGAGGGGGGIDPNSETPGNGGDGAPGFVRIKWEVSE